ncbi:MAG: hypothetical protein IKM30_07495 [Oscillospiraceae bacterium]|nr:hypothetical protein [Oscillospiraceae bacterium]
MFHLFKKKDTFNVLDMFSDYEMIHIHQIKTRAITESEYKAVNFSYKSKFNSIFTLSGMVFVLFCIFAVCTFLYYINHILKGEPIDWMELFIWCAVNFYTIGISLAIYIERRNQVIAANQQVSPGEVVATVLKRGTKNITLGAYHTIALHGSKQIVSIYSTRVIKEGKTVLVVVNHNTKSPYMICVPKKAVDYSSITSKYEHNELLGDSSEYTDYAMADLKDVVDSITPAENAKINLKERLLGPFKYGGISAIWVFFTIVTILMAFFLIKSFTERNSEVFFPLLMGFLCELIIEHVICKGVIKKKVSPLDSGILECIVAQKTTHKHDNTKYVHAIIPERKQFVNLSVTPYDYKRLSWNERVTLVVKISTSEVRWVIRK